MKYRLYKTSKSNKFYFQFIDEDGLIILQSKAYSSIDERNLDLNKVFDMSSKASNYRIKTVESGKIIIDLYDLDKHKLASSVPLSEFQKDMVITKCINEIKSLKKKSSDSPNLGKSIGQVSKSSGSDFSLLDPKKDIITDSAIESNIKEIQKDLEGNVNTSSALSKEPNAPLPRIEKDSDSSLAKVDNISQANKSDRFRATEKAKIIAEEKNTKQKVASNVISQNLVKQKGLEKNDLSKENRTISSSNNPDKKSGSSSLKWILGILLLPLLLLLFKKCASEENATVNQDRVANIENKSDESVSENEIELDEAAEIITDLESDNQLVVKSEGLKNATIQSDNKPVTEHVTHTDSAKGNDVESSEIAKVVNSKQIDENDSVTKIDSISSELGNESTIKEASNVKESKKEQQLIEVVSKGKSLKKISNCLANNGCGFPMNINWKDVKFDYNENRSSDSETGVNELFNILKSNKSLKLKIVGNISQREDEDFLGSFKSEKGMLTLSKLRARNVYNALNKMGISESRLTFQGDGNNNPISTDNTPEGRQLNRRINLIFSK